MHEFRHEGAVTGIEFHPHEFILATSSADKTVKLWDLETFAPIESLGPEATGVRGIAFHGEGRQARRAAVPGLGRRGGRAAPAAAATFNWPPAPIFAARLHAY